MDVTSFFTDVQSQFNETQRRLTELWDESQKQMMESQQKFASVYMDSFPIKTNSMDVAETFQQALSFQKELIGSVMKNQEVALRLSIETQKQFWDSYFENVQKMMQSTQNS